MVVVKPRKNLSYYMDNRLVRNLDVVKKRVQTKDRDFFFIVDGEEGSGKSVKAQQIAAYLDPDFCLERICFTPLEFMNAVMKAKKNQCIVYDEAFTGLSSRAALSEINHLLVSLMMEMRQKNLFIIIVLPTYFMLDKYVAIWRAKGLFNVYMRKGQRGFWKFYNKQKKKLLYLRGKKEYSYSCVKTAFRGRFTNKYVVDEQEYRKKKAKALKSRDRRTKSEKFKAQRDTLVWMLYNEAGFKLADLVDLFKEYKIMLKKTAINDILQKFKKKE